MPRHRLVPTLQTLAMRCIGVLIVRLSSLIVKQLQYMQEPDKICNQKLANINVLLATNIPIYLFDQMAVEVLSAVKELIEKTKRTFYPRVNMSAFLTEMNVVVQLTEVVLNAHLKRINFTDWPKIMRYVLYKNLPRLSGLEVLNLGSCTGGWRTASLDKYVLDGITNMKNLHTLCLCFDCTDQVIQALSENCPQIRNVDITSSGSVTDRSVAYLLKCSRLRELQLHSTSVTSSGLAQLVRGLPSLQDIGRCDDFGTVIKTIQQSNFNRPLNLRKIQARYLTTECLRLLVDIFPKVEQINLFNDEEVTDLTILISLENLKHLKLLSCAFYGDYLKQLIEVRGENISSLHLEHAEELNFNVLMDISEYCPHLNSLVLYNCDFMETLDLNRKLRVQPFQKLERLFWMVDCARAQLEFILLHAVNIKNVHLGSSTGITHASIVRILAVNPMSKLEELRILYSGDMTMQTVQLLLASCLNLRVLSELESWQGIGIEELQEFKRHIVASNYDLDVRPTLSYY